ncbi:BPSL0761 family protein [Paraburkholderia sp. LEh10]|uniref:BPSL0761 family protein n=1 Tax=Paraburkholderia sp. LEh10 TaxID=2821353 RepID=UPI0028AC5DA3|nr:BPSL0761 family protein [Paraburkholderia sp. LEh10]
MVRAQRRCTISRRDKHLGSGEGEVTTPHERTRAVVGARDLLTILSDGRGPYSGDLVRTLALTLLRHYPLEVDIAVSAAALPGVWAEPVTVGKAVDIARVRRR